MINAHHKGDKPGYYYQKRGRFVWWPTKVWRGKPWPKEVPFLKATNCWGPESPEHNSYDRRSLDEWIDGFPFDKEDLVYQAIKKAAKDVTGVGWRGGQRVWQWSGGQDAATKAAVWNRAMELLGYTDGV